MKKRLLCLLMVLLLTFTVVVNDYNEAKAVTGVEETFLISALLSFIASTAITKSGIVPDAVEILSDFIESEIDVSDFHIMLKDLINKVNSGIPVSDSEMELYNEWVNGVQEFYLDLIRDMNNTGAIDEDSALAYITKLFDYDYVSEKDVREAFNMYCTMSNAVQTSKEAVKFGVSNNVIACNKEFANCLSNEMSNAINLYMQKRNSSSDNTYSKEFEHCYLRFFFDNSFNLPSSDSDFIQFISSLECPYIAYRFYGYDGAVLYSVYYRENANYISGDYQSSNNAIYFYFSDNGGLTSSKCAYKNFDNNGIFVRESNGYRSSNFSFYTNQSNSYDILFWNNLHCVDTLLDLVGASSIPIDNSYDVYVPSPSSSIPIDDLYNGSENRGQDIDTDIDSDVPIYSIDTSINDLADEIANLRVTIDNIDTDVPYEDYVKAINDAVNGVSDKAEPKVEEGVKEDIAVEMANANWSINDFKTSGLGSKFPFCIPYDLINLISVFNAEPVAPKFEIPFVFEKWGINESYTIDLSIFDNIAKIFRTFETLWFIGFLIMKTRGLIKG